jgi:hypothetical protein
MGHAKNPFHASMSSLMGFSNPDRAGARARRGRSTRFAPEGLEMRLSPAALGLTPPAQVSRPDGEGPLEPAPPDGDGETPPIEPTLPLGPSDPA